MLVIQALATYDLAGALLHCAGPRRASLAEKHVAMMKKRTDTLVVVPCDQLLEGKDSEFGVRDAFKLVDAQLRDAVKGLADMLMVWHSMALEQL